VGKIRRKNTITKKQKNRTQQNKKRGREEAEKKPNLQKKEVVC
jgi:hypothetical protein